MSIAFIQGGRVRTTDGDPLVLFRAECRQCGRWASLPVSPTACMVPSDAAMVMARLRKRLTRRGCGHADQTAPRTTPSTPPPAPRA